MSQIDKDRTLKGSNGRLLNRSQWDKYNANSAQRAAAMDTLAAGVGSVTSRDQIINPQSMIDPSMYENTRAGRAQYESDLAALTNFQSQQEAAYQEWYDSPEQAALRERAAGLNPDLVGLENAGESAEAPVSDAVPGANLPTNGQIALNAVTGIASLLGTVASSAASLISLPSTITASIASAAASNAAAAASKATADTKVLESTVGLGAALGDEISSLYAAAQQSALDSGIDFDPVAWFNEDRNFDTLEPVYGKFPNYKAVLQHQRKLHLNHRKNAASLQKDWASDQFDFGKIYSDPLFSDSQKIMITQTAPLVGYFRDVEKAELKWRKTKAEIDEQIKAGTDVDTAIDAANEQNEYLASLDGKLKAADEEFRRDCEIARFKRERQMHDALFMLYEKNPASVVSANAAFLLGGLAPKQYGDFMSAYGVAYGLNHLNEKGRTANPYDPQNPYSHRDNFTNFANPFTPNMRFLQEESGRNSFIPYGYGLF